MIKGKLHSTIMLPVKIWGGLAWRLGLSSKQRSVFEIANELGKRNSRLAMEEFYSRDEILKCYLSPERLEFYKEVAVYLQAIPAHRIVDLGCGSGHFLRQALDHKTRTKGIVKAHGLDYAISTARRAAQLVSEASFVVADLYSCPYYDDTFDLVTAIEVFEHLSHPFEALQEGLRICANGGNVVITVPDGAQDDWGGHVNFWTEDEFRQFVQAFDPLAKVYRIEQGRALLAHLTKTDNIAQS